MQLTLPVPESNPNGHMTDPIIFTFMVSAAQGTAQAPGYHTGNSDVSCREILGSWPHRLPDPDGNNRENGPDVGMPDRMSALSGQCCLHVLLHEADAHTTESVLRGEDRGSRQGFL